MAAVKFTKMEGIGNDYVYIDATKTDVRLNAEQIQKLSDRNFGIGGDGVIFIRNSDKGDFMMDMYNSDGSSSEMCGNGIRCVAKYIYDHGLTNSKNPKIETGAGVLAVDLSVDSGNKVNLVSVDMGKPILIPSKIPILWKNEETVLEQPLEIAGKNLKFTAVSMGNPHCVIFVEDGDRFPVREIGPLIETHSLFPRRINVEFVTVRGKDHLYQRTWERGAGETLACGTGACAVMVAGNLTGRSGKDVRIDLRGGTLRIQWQESGHVLMTGPAREIFSGEVEI
ncbi:diaminopimelate epimerase [Leptospira gomenensis]|uniref:Diaminopimelate epimerase n=1 Tax=Leptospira gomenensis TaxID=2484974 RepID=A0A5F1YS14_9LEPT|nr:diaminopimelate epimerase [Leptospira gomenensis]TGK28069.1 diaminopimelate epimerase [Leptospira gomenensis]TGK37075.1 diaminopimelate epimerase [Leptospira gomenensis]TGK45711.1 diaminopimelate epimerase [Leptospira gomenensis]TGK59650.1 diaminopimelate epimerase [Leptospira gomenensis]